SLPQERARRREELKQLKNLKREELAARIARIRDASGSEAFGLSHSLLQEDFDPASHDRLMAVGPQNSGNFSPKIPVSPPCPPHSTDEWNWDSWTGPEEGEPPAEPHCEDPDFVMDADFVPGAPPDPAAPPGRAPPEVSFGKRRRKSRFREALEREKPLFDPAYSPKPFLGPPNPSWDPPKPSLAPPNPLSAPQILAADDKELNRWCSLRKTCMYRSEQEERQDQANYSRRAQNLSKKHQILRSLVAGPEEEEEEAAPAKPKFGKKRREKRKRQEEEAGKGEPPSAPPKNPGGPRRRGGPPLGAAVRLGGREFSGKRLEAFGLNPRRLRFRQLWRQRGKEGGVRPEEPQKKTGSSGKNTGNAAVNGKKQKRRKNVPNPQKNT
ncbi:KRI1 protein, partial [Copsychus sechellarum]|nr:KRI1 protein [Copsychus sechellarum]